MRFVKAVWCAAALVACLAPGIRADEWNKKTILTFSGPVQIPGATLAAGTYVFKLADLASNRHVVQVFDKDEKKIYGTILAIPDQRMEPSDKPVVLFAERPAGIPQAVKAWFYPGETIGNEFVYPKDQALTIAKATHQSVLSMDDTSTATTTDAERMDSMKTAKVTRIDERGQSTDVTTTTESTETATTTTAGTTTTTAASTTTEKPASTATTTSTSTTTTAAASTTTESAAVAAPPAAPVAPAPTEPAATTTLSQDARLKNSSSAAVTPEEPAAVGTSGQVAEKAPPAARAELPRTASRLPVFGLFGALALVSAFGVRRVRARVARVR